MLFCADHRFPMQKYVHKSKNILKLKKFVSSLVLLLIVDLKSDERVKKKTRVNTCITGPLCAESERLSSRTLIFLLNY